MRTEMERLFIEHVFPAPTPTKRVKRERKPPARKQKHNDTTPANKNSPPAKGEYPKGGMGLPSGTTAEGPIPQRAKGDCYLSFPTWSQNPMEKSCALSFPRKRESSEKERWQRIKSPQYKPLHIDPSQAKKSLLSALLRLFTVKVFSRSQYELT